MKRTNYDELQFDITTNKHFTMIERPGPSRDLSTLKDRYRRQQRLQILRLDHGGHPQEPDNVFREIFLDLSGFI